MFLLFRWFGTRSLRERALFQEIMPDQWHHIDAGGLTKYNFWYHDTIILYHGTGYGPCLFVSSQTLFAQMVQICLVSSLLLTIVLVMDTNNSFRGLHWFTYVQIALYTMYIHNSHKIFAHSSSVLNWPIGVNDRDMWRWYWWYCIDDWCQLT